MLASGQIPLMVITIKVQAECNETGAYKHMLTAKVPTMKLDDICNGITSEARLIHMDIEGAEPGTILGAQELIAGSRDLFMIFEWSSMRHKGKWANSS